MYAQRHGCQHGVVKRTLLIVDDHAGFRSFARALTRRIRSPSGLIGLRFRPAQDLDNIDVSVLEAIVSKSYHTLTSDLPTARPRRRPCAPR